MPLTINSRVFNNLSGPIGITILTPKHNVNLPSLILMGETHTPVTLPCTTDTATPQEVFHQFIEQINILAETNNIHFYTENFMDKEILEIIRNSEISEIDKNLQASNIFKRFKGVLSYTYDDNFWCYYNDLKTRSSEVFNKRCKYPNIKWQFSDARHTYKKDYNFSLENIMQIDIYFKEIIDTMHKITPEYLKSHPYPKWLGTQEYSNNLDTQEEITKTREYFIKKIQIGMPVPSGMVTDDDIVIKIQDAEITKWLTLLISFFNGNYETFVDEIMQERIFDKQIIKSNFTATEIIYIRSMMVNYFDYVMQLNCSNEDVIALLPIYIDFLQQMLNFKNNSTDNNLFMELMTSVEKFRHANKLGPDILFESYRSKAKIHDCYLTAPFSALLDIYLMLRIYKQNLQYPIDLVCAVIGNQHVYAISEFFIQNYHKYFDIYQFNPYDPSRQPYPTNQCIDLNHALVNKRIQPFNMNLNQMITNVAPVPETTCIGSFCSMFGIRGGTKKKKRNVKRIKNTKRKNTKRKNTKRKCKKENVKKKM